MAPGPIESALPESSSSEERSEVVVEDVRFKELRGVQWRLNLGILPLSSSVDDLRRVTADCRRRYARMRRRLLVDPPKDGSSSPDLAMDNPLSQNPESTWGRFFRNAELEKMVDQDLSRLYPEHGSYFQTPGCQGMLRRILLLWCLRHPECGYRQGMHELLAPLLYVLHVDVEGLSQVRKLYEDHFTDKFDDLSYDENDSTYNFDLKNLPDSMENEDSLKGDASKVKSLDELDPKIQTIVMLSDAYGAEGELGIILSEKFMEHDAYCMFDALMSGANGSLSMAEFFSPSPAVGSQTSLPPVIEASAALYHFLSLVDSSLHSHLVELGVEPQYFALRWLRVLFGREFSLANLLIIWDEIFIRDNLKLDKGGEDDAGSSFRILGSPRGAIISALAVSMLLHLRSSLLATENATACLQRLLNFPENIDLKKLIQKATSLQALALEKNCSSSFHSYMGPYEHGKSKAVRGHSLSIDSVSQKTPLSLVTESYWEEKWRVMQREEELRQDNLKKLVPSQKKRWTEKVRLTLSRSESDPSPAKRENGKKTPRFTVRRNLLEDLSRVLSSEEDIEKLVSHEDKSSSKTVVNKDGVSKDLTSANEDRCLNGNPADEENSPVSSYPASPLSGANDDPESEKSSVGSNLSVDENNDNPNDVNLQSVSEGSPHPVSDPPESVSIASESTNHSTRNSVTGKERKVLSGKFPRFWKLGWSAAGEGTSEKGSNAHDTTKSPRSDIGQIAASSSMAETSNSVSCKGETVDQNRTSTLRNLGDSMLDQIQVIESAFQQDHGVQLGSVENCSKNTLVGKGQVTAIAALKELRKISNLLSEM
ncbi:uncharacterized protein LOC126790612 [Argentina anserina]|uniref:uncharacterized protein LOC126790612 n=1 Tax=Argentina anserina TaxID=57926 RepID=UPI002176255E|nr:uncharacterized protein LOC126790612 [Potentilla anserina]